MIRQEFSITRTRATFKPRVNGEDLPFFRDGAGNLLLGTTGDADAFFSGSQSTASAQLPYAALNEGGADGRQAGVEAVALVDAGEVSDRFKLDYRIDGGFNNNCVVVTWEAEDGVSNPVWVCLKTFTGMQLKYALPGKRKRMVFALADEDAFAYCDKAPCIECGFRCKSGFVLYAYVRELGVVSLPLERISTSEVLKADH